MLFNDYPFLLIFLPAAIAIYRLVDPYSRWRMGALVFMSFVFYGYWNPPFIALLALSILVNWLAARAYAATKHAEIITGAIVANLAVLAVFKYANFFAENLGFILDQPLWRFDIVLPLGISFFTFHHIMYLVDLRAGRRPTTQLTATRSIFRFFRKRSPAPWPAGRR